MKRCHRCGESVNRYRTVIDKFRLRVTVCLPCFGRPS